MPYTQTHHQDSRVILTKTDGNEITAVRMLVGNRKPQRTFEDSRLADSTINCALDLLEKFDNGEITADQAADYF